MSASGHLHNSSCRLTTSLCQCRVRGWNVVQARVTECRPTRVHTRRDGDGEVGDGTLPRWNNVVSR